MNAERWGERAERGPVLTGRQLGARTLLPLALLVLLTALDSGCRSEPAPAGRSNSQVGSGATAQPTPADEGERPREAAEATWPASYAALLPRQSGVVGVIHLDALAALEAEDRLPPLDWWRLLDIVPVPGDAQDFYAFLRQHGVDIGRPVVFASYPVERNGLLEAARTAAWLFGRAPVPAGSDPMPTSVEARLDLARQRAAEATAGVRLLIPVAAGKLDEVLTLIDAALAGAEPVAVPSGTEVRRAFELSPHTIAFVRLTEGFAIVDVIVPGAEEALDAATTALEPLSDRSVPTAARPVVGEVLAVSVVDETPGAYELATVMTNAVRATEVDVVSPEDWPVILSSAADYGSRSWDLFWLGPLGALANRGFRLALNDDALTVELWRRGGDASAVASGAVTPVYLAGRATVQFPKAALATPASVWRALGLTPLPPVEVDTEALGWRSGANQGALPRLAARLALGLAEAVPEPVRAAVAASGEAESIVLPFDRPGEALAAFGVVLLPGASAEAANALLICFEQGVAPPYCPRGQLEIDEEPRRLAAGDSAAHLRGWSYRLAQVDDRAIVWLEAPGVRIETAGAQLAEAGLNDVVGVVSLDVGPLAASESDGDRSLGGQLSGVAGRDRLDLLLEPGSEGLTWRLPYRPGERTPTSAQRPQFVPALELVQDLPVEAPGPCARFRDRDGDARLDGITRYDYDRLGRLISAAIDRNIDGEADQIIHYGYPGAAEADDPVSVERVDADADGRIDLVARRQYDSTGRLLIEVTSETEAGAEEGQNGTATVRALRYELNEDDGGTYVYERYASAGRPFGEEHLIDLIPALDEPRPWRVEETDAAGRVTAEHVQASGGNTRTTRYEYDDAGNRLSEIATRPVYGGERTVSHDRFDYACWTVDADGGLSVDDRPEPEGTGRQDLTRFVEAREAE